MCGGMLAGHDEGGGDIITTEHITSKVKDIYIALDTDAKNRALEIGEKFLNQGKRVFLVDLPDKDPSEMGFKPFTEHIQTAQKLDISGIMLHKLDL